MEAMNVHPTTYQKAFYANMPRMCPKQHGAGDTPAVAVTTAVATALAPVTPASQQRPGASLVCA